VTASEASVNLQGRLVWGGVLRWVELPRYRRRQVQVAVVGDTVEISIGTRLIRTHPVKHDRTREHGALANPEGRPNRINAAQPTTGVR
jgi:hypothetical protein